MNKRDRRFLLAFQDPKRALRLAEALALIRALASDAHGFDAGRLAVMDTALPVEHATVVTLVGRLTRAGMLVKSGAYHRSSAPKRTYRKINNRFWARDTRRYRLGDWPEFE